ncbi:hypothetical protein [[Mycoplasma] mobile]|uniref:Expressed protein n=1 Tax=Mycoplasma mobile (strain ATCC 43663 / 163K / NCTC 11711) TaxID=267748 RepID=Q6KH40_MYCM1|nr:hypothetical protein [[Mycoplasma] mobile]AAT28091.1 expressed protein [Mycoplasma mobile 163K]
MEKTGKLKNNNDINNVELNPIKTAGKPGNALALKNNTNQSINYWYSDNGINKWYLHTIPASSSTWDWQWSNFWTGYAMVIEIPLNDKESKYIVPVFVEYKNEVQLLSEFPLTNIYSQIGAKGQCPSFKNEKWYWEYMYLYPGKIDSFAVFHTNLNLEKDGTFSWNS